MTTFLDTNILIYAVDPDPASAQKRNIATDLIHGGSRVLSVQVLNEFVVQTTRVGRPGRLSRENALALTMSWRRFPVVDLTLRLFDAAAEVQRATQYAWWDSLIVAAALSAGCDSLATEDMQHGRVIDGLRIENPFRDMA